MAYHSQYDAVADIYDAYVRADFDLQFFREEAARADGPILELMAGTGRVTTVLAASSAPVTCVDRSARMLRRLAARFGSRPRNPHIVCTDVRALPFDRPYALVAVPFHSLAEIVHASERRMALAEVQRLLAPAGRFVVTLHNPARRRETLDGRPRHLGDVPLPGGDGQLGITITGRLDPASNVATMDQEFVARNQAGVELWRRTQVLRFALIGREDMEAAARAAGLSVLACYGDYDRSSFDAHTSPYLIWVFERSETG
jgi:SAM-dependent methyltransferase